MRQIVWLLGLSLALLSCKTNRVRSWPFFPEDAPVTESGELARRGSCNAWQNHLPDPAHPEDLPVRYLRVNFHIMNSRDSSRNFQPDSARAYFRRLLELANADLDTNFYNWRSPEGTAVLPKRYHYVLWPQPGIPGDDGFYFHYDDSLYYLVYKGKNQNNYN
ncbi:MAG: hypothetical protein IT259_11800, partial [Saprospiraceae bacterium]|nr:hypothetical protein [Saprospiraceae bacterium]